jgi:quinol-cytochrome oxidoreductase complex cytochrome b subunit
MVGTWVGVAPWRALVHYVGPWGPVLIAFMLVALLLLPLVDRSLEVDLRRRPAALVLGAIGLVFVLVAAVAGWQLQREGPSYRHVTEAVTPFGGEAEPTPAPPEADTGTEGSEP